LYCAIVVCICTRVIVVLSLCANVFVSAARSFFFFSTSTNKNYTLCLWWRLFFVFDQKFVQTAKAQNFLPIATFFFCLVRYVVYTTLSLSFRSSRRRQQRDDLFSRSSRLALLRSAQNVSSFSRGKRWKDYILFLRAQKRKLLPPLLLVLLSSCDLSSFYNYL
jgi:hypothetical protein